MKSTPDEWKIIHLEKNNTKKLVRKINPDSHGDKKKKKRGDSEY